MDGTAKLEGINLAESAIVADLAWAADEIARILDTHREIYGSLGSSEWPISAPASLFVLCWNLETLFNPEHAPFLQRRRVPVVKAAPDVMTGFHGLLACLRRLVKRLKWTDLIVAPDKFKASRVAGISANYPQFCLETEPICTAFREVAKCLRNEQKAANPAQADASADGAQIIEIPKRVLAEGLGISDETLRLRVEAHLVSLHGNHGKYAKRVRINVMQFSPDERRAILAKAALDTSRDVTAESQAVARKPNSKAAKIAHPQIQGT